MTHPAMNEAEETAWQGKYITAKVRGTWEYVSRSRGIGAAVILAVHDDAVILVEQFRVPLGRNCIELPAGLIGDDETGEAPELALRASSKRKPAFAPAASKIWANSIRRRAWSANAST